MVLPGWNVTEPLNVAISLCRMVREYHGALNEMKDFAASVGEFCLILEAFKECLARLDTIPPNVLQRLQSTSSACQICMEECKTFTDRFSADRKVGPGQRLTWMWKEKTAAKLMQNMLRQKANVTLHILMTHRLEETPTIPSSPPTVALIPSTLPTSTNPTLPGSTDRVVAVLSPSRDREEHMIALSRTRSMTAVLDSSFSTAETLTSTCEESRQDGAVPHEILQTRDSDLGVGLLVVGASMDDLHGAEIYYKSPKSEPRPIQKIEFVKDTNGSLRYIVASLPEGFKNRVKFFQKVSISPPTIPHMEHPTAYKDQKEYLVRFLEPHEVTSQRWPGSPNPASSSSPSVASSHGLSSPSGYPTPDTVASSCSIRSGFSLGPPILSIDSYQIKDEMRYPRYRFQNEHDCEVFQEGIMGKTLLLNAPVEKIECKPVAGPKRQGCEKQYLRLWENDQRSQTLMYYANTSPVSHIYLEHNVDCFYPIEAEEISTRVRLRIKRPGEPPPNPPSRRTSARSLVPSPKIFPKWTRQQSVDDETWRETELSDALRSLEYMDITFTDEDDKKKFLIRARFDVSPPSPNSPSPILLENPF